MNIILFVNKDFEANLTYNLLKPELLQHNVRIYYTSRVGKAQGKPEALQEIEYYEKEYFFNKVVNYIKANTIATDFEFFGDDFSSFDFMPCSNVNSPTFIAEVSAFDPDLFISIRFGKIFKEAIIDIPKKGILNLHSAILPDYKGIFGTLHNLREDKTQYGCTLHYISNSGIDTGEIIDIAKLDTDKSRSLLWHVLQLYPQGAKMISQNIHLLKSQEKLPFKTQNKSQGTYYSVPTKAHFDELIDIGYTTFAFEDYIELLSQFISPQLKHLA